MYSKHCKDFSIEVLETPVEWDGVHSRTGTVQDCMNKVFAHTTEAKIVFKHCVSSMLVFCSA